jgi:hypothetical protein
MPPISSIKGHPLSASNSLRYIAMSSCSRPKYNDATKNATRSVAWKKIHPFTKLESQYGRQTEESVTVSFGLGGVLVESGAVSICDIFLLELTRDLVSIGLPNLWFWVTVSDNSRVGDDGGNGLSIRIWTSDGRPPNTS